MKRPSTNGRKVMGGHRICRQVEQQGVVFVFGARPLIQAGELVRELRGHFKGTAIVGCSTSGEIVGDTVVDDSVIATAVEFEHTRLRTTSAKIGEAKSSTR